MHPLVFSRGRVARSERQRWAWWSDAVREAGFIPNELKGATNEEVLLEKYAEFVIELGRLPASGDLRMRRKNDGGFPSHGTFDRFGTKVEMAKRLLDFCSSKQRFAKVVEVCESYVRSDVSEENGTNTQKWAIGYVYLLKHGSRKEYKIGRTNNRLRREGEIGVELPEVIEPIHVIETDDPSGIEAHWHRRFAEKRLKNEWFALSRDEVKACKRWRRIN